jgi:GNAT superfamily N-acetyltransferase
MSTISIRVYKPTDSDAVRELFLAGMESYSGKALAVNRWYAPQQLGPGGDLYCIEKSYDHNQPDLHACFWIAEELETGTVVGMVGAQPVIPDVDQHFHDAAKMLATTTEEGGGSSSIGLCQWTEVELRRLSVSTKFQRRGVARQLVNTLETWAAGQGYKRVTLTTLEMMASAVAFYPSLGYTRGATELVPLPASNETGLDAVDITHFSKELCLPLQRRMIANLLDQVEVLKAQNCSLLLHGGGQNQKVFVDPFKAAFPGRRRVFFVVIHLVDPEDKSVSMSQHAAQQAKIAVENGADGVFLITGTGGVRREEVLEAYEAVRTLCGPGLFVGLNFMDAQSALQGVPAGCQALWTDYGVDLDGVSEKATALAEARRRPLGGEHDCLWFAGFLFKGKRREFPKECTSLEDQRALVQQAVGRMQSLGRPSC